jgi:hypothetical protein
MLLSQEVIARKSCVGEKLRSEMLSVGIPSLTSTSLLMSPVVEVAAGAELPKSAIVVELLW